MADSDWTVTQTIVQSQEAHVALNTSQTIFPTNLSTGAKLPQAKHN